jgi:hypothetical protein
VRKSVDDNRFHYELVSYKESVKVFNNLRNERQILPPEYEVFATTVG